MDDDKTSFPKKKLFARCALTPNQHLRVLYATVVVDRTVLNICTIVDKVYRCSTLYRIVLLIDNARNWVHQSLK